MSGFYFNPGNAAFCSDARSEIYVDKTLLLNELNKKLCTNDNCFCVTHARRFGKSQAADLLIAYYSKGCNSEEILSKYKIAQQENWTEHLNKYNVVRLDMSSIIDNNYKNKLVSDAIRRIVSDMKEDFQDELDYDKSINELIYSIYKKTNTPFVITIDEWDAVIREYGDDEQVVHGYLQFLHKLFKSAESKEFLALGYITGIIPIKKIKNESALNNFQEYTMVNSGNLTEFYGFTEEEVKELCQRFDMDSDAVTRWYNGYLINGKHMYNPNSVCRAMQRKQIDSYWKNTSSYGTINDLINLNYGGLRDDILSLLAGGRLEVDVKTFQNDLLNLRNKDEVITALIHLGYLGYDAEYKEAYMPNYEVATAFESAMATDDNWGKVGRSIADSDRLLSATIRMDTDKVVKYLDFAHDAYSSVFEYNDENSLSCVLTMAYFTAQGYYNIVRELPTGKGFADFAFLPMSNAGRKPPMLVELKWNRSADTAIKQIKERRYAGKLSEYKEILMVGINYSTRTKKHTCKFEKISIE